MPGLLPAPSIASIIVPTPPPTVLSRVLKWSAAALLLPFAAAALYIAVIGWNWLRSPIERMAMQQTGRVLTINGDLGVKLAWPVARLRADTVTFANPPWAKEAQMVAAKAVEVAVDLPQLLQRKVAFPEVRLEQASVSLEQAGDGRKSWLLDLNQQDEGARIPIGRVLIEKGTLGYIDAAQKTSIRAELSTQSGSPAGLTFSALGQYKGLALKAQGSGDPVLALRDETTPYGLKLDATLGHTVVSATGTITSLLKFSAVDMRLVVHGDSLDQLFPLLGIAFPATHPYATEGHLLHDGKLWRYQQFSGRVGSSDLAGSLQLDTVGQRPLLTADLQSKRLDLDDLAPIVGVRPASGAATAPRNLTPKRVLPDLPFRTERWRSVDAQVLLRATTLRRAKALPLDNLVVHLGLHDAVLTLDPLHFGIAGGQLDADISLDGRTDPILAQARIQARGMHLAKLFPTFDLNKNSIGQVNGKFDLSGHGNSIAAMLATSNGRANLVVSGGEVSQLMMEELGLHLWEIVGLQLTGDRLVKLRCAVADFDVKNGSMTPAALLVDTQVTTIIGSGSVDLKDEKLDLTLNQKTKNTSPLALRSPITIRGSFAQPQVGVDKGRLAARAAGALALGLVNPLLAFLPLVDVGPGQDRDCAQLVRDTRAAPHSGVKAGKAK